MPPKIDAFGVNYTTNIASFLDLKDRAAFRQVSKNSKEGVRYAVSSLIPTLWEHGLFFQNLLKVKVATTSSSSNYAETTDSNLEAADSSFHHMLRILTDSTHPVLLTPLKSKEEIIERAEQLHHHYIEEILHTISEEVIYNKNIDESIRTLASRPPPSPDTFVIEVLTDDNEPNTDSLRAYLCKVLLKQENPVAARCILATLKSSYRKALALIEFVKTQPTQENIQEARNTIATLRCPLNKATALIEFVKVQPTPENIQEARSILTTFSGTYNSAAAMALIDLTKVQTTQENIQAARNFIATIMDKPFAKVDVLIELFKVHPIPEILDEIRNLIATLNPTFQAMTQIKLVKAHPTQEIIHDACNMITTLNHLRSKASHWIDLVEAQPTQEIIQEARNSIEALKNNDASYDRLVRVLLAHKKTNEARNVFEKMNDPKTTTQNRLTQAEYLSENIHEILHNTEKVDVPFEVKRAQIAMLQGNLKEARRVITNIRNLSEKAQAQIACFEILFTHPSAINPISSATSEIGVAPAASRLSVFPTPIISKAPPSQPALSK